MKKLCILLMILMMAAVLYTSCTNESTEDVKQNEPAMSKEMNYEELVRHYAEKHQVSAGDAEEAMIQMHILEDDPDESDAAKYRILSIPLEVDCKYQPMLELYTEIDGNDENWTVSRVKGAAFVGAVNDQSWQFAGNVAFWLRENRQIEYDVNGDFGQNNRASAYMELDIEEDGSEGRIACKMPEKAGELRNTAYCSQHDWVTYGE